MSRPRTVTVPDESGMGEETYVLGGVYFDPDYGQYFVRLSEFQARSATREEIAEHKAKQGAGDVSLRRSTTTARGD